MKVTMLQNACLEALTYVSKGTINNTSLPIFSGVLIKAYQGTVEFQTSDMDSSIRYKIPGEVDKKGGCVASALMLLSMIKNCPDAPVVFEIKDTYLSISCGSIHYSLPFLPKEDFPEFPTITNKQSIELPCQILSQMVDKVRNMSSLDSSHPILTGIYMHLENNVLKLVATDSFRLAICKTTIDSENPKEIFEVVINSKNITSALSLIRKEGNILIGVSDSQISFLYGNITYICKKLEGNFPNYKQLLPKECSTKIKVYKNDLTEALKRVSVVAQSNPAITFSVDIEKKSLTLLGKNVDSEKAEDHVEIDGQGNNITIGLNNRYVQDCLSSVDKDILSLELTEAVQPAVFKAPGDISFLYLLMPMRI